jgi:alpha-amylase
MLLSLLPILCLPLLSLALDNNAMRQRRVYQVVTDRFSAANGAPSASCNVAAAAYCGGTYKGLQSKLDYIQGMGFDTVWISPVVSNIGGTTGHGQAYHGYWTLDPAQLVS